MHIPGEVVPVAVNDHPLRRAAVIGTLTVSAFGLTGCALIGGNTDDSDRLATADKVSSYLLNEPKGVDHSHDPAFRATSITLAASQFLVGSGTLVRVGDKYELATIEHVARPLAGLKPLVKETGVGVQVAKEDDSKNTSFAIPGVGVFKLRTKPQFSGPAKPTSSSGIDRYTTFALTSQEETAVKQAVDNKQLAVPEKQAFKAAFGDEFYMPLADTGKTVPFVYIGQDDKNPLLVPLFVLDQGMNYRRGMGRLSGLMSAEEKQQKARNQQPYQSELAALAIDQLGDKVFRRYSKPAAAIRAAEMLPCLGDSGSPFLNRQQNIVGVLSSGTEFTDPSGQDSFAGLRIARRDDQTGQPTAARACLSTVELATGDQ